MDNKKELEQIFNLIEGLYSHTTELILKRRLLILKQRSGR